MFFDSTMFDNSVQDDLKPKLKEGNYKLTITHFSFVENDKGGYFSIKGIATDTETGQSFQWNDGVINGNNKKGFAFLLRNLHVQCDPEGDWSIPMPRSSKPSPAELQKLVQEQKDWMERITSKIVGSEFNVSVERGDYLNKFYYPNGFIRNTMGE